MSKLYEEAKKRLEEYGDILTVDDVHDILGIGYSKTYELLRTGAIKKINITASNVTTAAMA